MCTQTAAFRHKDAEINHRPGFRNKDLSRTRKGRDTYQERFSKVRLLFLVFGSCDCPLFLFLVLTKHAQGERHRDERWNVTDKTLTSLQATIISSSLNFRTCIATGGCRAKARQNTYRPHPLPLTKYIFNLKTSKAEPAEPANQGTNFSVRVISVAAQQCLTNGYQVQQMNRESHETQKHM